MAKETFTIEIPINVTDKTEPGVSSATKKMNAFDKTAAKLKSSLLSMSNTKFQVVMNALEKVSPVISAVKSKLSTLVGKAWSVTLSVIDKATGPFRSILSGLNSALGMLGVGLSVTGGIVIPIKMFIQQQNIETAFEVLLGSAEAAKQRVEELTTFAGSTPFTRDVIYESSRILEVFTGGALATGEGLRMVGDIAAGTQQDFGDVALWVGRMYDSMANGGPIGAMTSRLQEMGAINGQARERLEALAASGKDISEIWPEVTKEFARFDGMMDKMSGNLSNLLLGVKSFFTNNVFKRIGTGLGEGITPVLQQFREWRSANSEQITEWGVNLENSVREYTQKAMSRLTSFFSRASKLFGSTEFKEANFAGKIQMAWGAIIAEPFSEWWNSSGKAWFVEKAGAIGNAIGSGITLGLLALLGFDISGAMSDGMSIGGSFLSGFLDGFDTKAITSALLNWVSENKLLATGLGIVIGKKVISGVLSGLSSAKSMLDKLRSLTGGGKSGGLSGGSSSAYTTTMTVQATVVNVFGTLSSGLSGGGRGMSAGGGRGALPGGGKPLSLPGPAGAAGAGSKIGGIGGKIAGLGTAAVSGLGSIGTMLGSGATTAGGAALAGGASVAGGIGGLLGIGSGLLDIYKGSQSEGKEAQDKYFSGGTKIGMVGAGAAAGAAIGAGFFGIGAIPGALIGAGVGGISALLGGESLGKVISDAWDSVKGNVSNVLSEIGGKLAEAKASFTDTFTNIKENVQSKWGDFSDWFGDNVWTPIKDFGINVMNFTVGLFEVGKEWAAGKWEDFSGWFEETVWEPLKIMGGWAAEKISEKLMEARDWVSEKWGAFSGWFESTVWEPLKSKASNAAAKISGWMSSASDWIQEKWGAFSGWFSEAIWEPAKALASDAAQGISDWINSANDWIQEKWSVFSEWFSSTVWEPLKTKASEAAENVKTKWNNAKTFITTAWGNLSSWFSTNVWGPIMDKATSAASWVSSKWESAKSWAGDIINIGSQKTGVTTSGDGPTGGGGTTSGTGGGRRFASGGILTRPQIGLVAEAGPEAIIPLSATRRERGLELWQQAGELLGISMHADGGIMGNPKLELLKGGLDAAGISIPPMVDERSSIQPNINVSVSMPGQTKEDAAEAKQEININVEINPEIIINSASDTDAGDIADVIRAQLPDIADDLCGEIAERLGKVFANMPSKGVA